MLLLVPLMFLTSPTEAFHGRRETRAERVSKKTDRLPDEMIFLRALCFLEIQTTKEEERDISSAKNEKRANNAPHECVRERNRRFLGEKSRT